MGIPGLITALGPGERISLSKLAISHLERTSRPIRIAVDISIWLFQVQAGRGGKNPELRTLFYRLLKILALPIHPLFVYDGKDKPPFKRGKAVSRSYGSAPIIHLSKILIDLFKFPRHDAPGEAEAECARLQTDGVVDAVMSNDVDALMFGSTLTVMNFSKESGSGGATHVTCYDMADDKVKLDRSGMILFAMLSGGDYLPSGVPKCGSKLAAEIAKAGFGADLLEALDSDDPEASLNDWRERLQYELEENESGYFQTKHKVVRIPEAFPDRTILSYYAQPVVSVLAEVESLRNRLRYAWDQDIDVMQIRQFVADTFEWNYRSGARKVIRLLAEPLVSHNLRLGKHLLGNRLSDIDAPMLQKVYKSRISFSTDGMTELQVDIVPVDIVGLDLFAEEPNPPLPSQGSIASDEDEPNMDELNVDAAPQSPTKKRVTKRYDPYSSEKVWVFESLASIGIPGVVENWKKEQSAKLSSTPKKSTTNRKSGPRKRKDLDPTMKQGSILKYGTLTKGSGRSAMSEFKQAQLFEAAVSTESTRSPQHPGLGNYANCPDGFDYLVNKFSTCNLSTSPGVKRHPMATRLTRIAGQCTAIGSSGAEIEVVELLSEDDSRPSDPSGKIRMSYSNASYKPQNSIATEAFDIVRSQPTPTPTPHCVESEIQELEHLICSIQLDQDVTEKPKAHSCLRKEDPQHPPESCTCSSCRNSRDILPIKTHPIQKKDDSCNDPIDPTQGPPTHAESITVCDGYWITDPSSAPMTEDSNKPSQNDKKKGKKRIPRVSILDLT